MKKILIQYLYIFLVVLLMLIAFTWVNACERDKPEQALCEKDQKTTQEKPCIEKLEENGNINTVIEGIIKLGESKTLPQ